MKKLSRRKKILLFLAMIILTGFLIPQDLRMPVQGATLSSYHPQSFWYYPWGKSGTHKGVDIFAKKGTKVFSATQGIVLYTGEIAMGGKVVLVLGPKWRVHYYAHLDSIHTSTFSYVAHTEQIGSVGNSGNAQGKPAHLHYSIVTLIPYLWRWDADQQGWKKIWYLNPIRYF